MTSVEKTYTLNKIQQLVDLNGDTTNFDLTFTVLAKDNSSFEALVIDQKTLDSGDEIQFKKAEGTISGNIVTDNGVYQNYFLILKSDKPSECVVTIDKKEIPERQETVLPSHLLKAQDTLSSQSFFTTRNIIICLAIIGLLVFLYYYFNTKKEMVTEEPSNKFYTNILKQEELPKIVPSVVSVPKPLSLIDRLNKLNLDE